VSNPPEPDGPPSNGSDGRGLPVARAGLVLVAFVVVTILLLGVIHPSAAKSASGSAASPAVGTTIPTAASSPSTTSPTHSTTPTTTVAPSKVSVLVANASGVTGAAASVTNELQPGGWNLASPVNASAKVATSSVYYLAGQQQSALASTVVGPYTTAAPISSIGTAEVLVVVGPDLATRATASTTTTAATTATTAARSSSTSSTSHH
jgi:hypothetical protein